MSTIALFGASGKIGRLAAHRLAQHGHHLRALTHKSPLPPLPNLTSIPGSITDPAAVAETLRGAQFVLHLATAKEDPNTFFDVSIRGTFHVLEACRQHPVQQLILLGGDAAQGIWFYPQPVPIDEHHPKTAYPGHYAFSKVIEETMAEQYQIQYGIPISILRSSWVFEADDLLRHFSLLENVNPAEPGHGFGNASPEALALARNRQERIPILLDARGTPLRRHIVHIDDVLHALDLILGNPSALGQSFNIASPAPFEYRVAAQYLSAKLGIPTIEIPCPHYHSFEINIHRARSILGYQPKNDFFQMADRAIAARNHASRQP